jgi:hypothetical protein
VPAETPAEVPAEIILAPPEKILEIRIRKEIRK